MTFPLLRRIFSFAVLRRYRAMGGRCHLVPCRGRGYFHCVSGLATGGLGWIDIDLVCSHEKRCRETLGDFIWLLTEEPTSIFYIDVATTDRRPFHIRHPRYRNMQLPDRADECCIANSSQLLAIACPTSMASSALSMVQWQQPSLIGRVRHNP